MGDTKRTSSIVALYQRIRLSPPRKIYPATPRDVLSLCSEGVELAGKKKASNMAVVLTRISRERYPASVREIVVAMVQWRNYGRRERERGGDLSLRTGWGREEQGRGTTIRVGNPI